MKTWIANLKMWQKFALIGVATWLIVMVTRVTTRSVEESAAAAESLSQQAAHLAQTVSTFKTA